MRILFLSQLLPLPLDAGPKVRSYYTLRYLVEAGHDVTLASFRRASDREESIEELRKLVTALATVELTRSRWRDAYMGARSMLTQQSFLIARDHVPAFHALLQKLCEERCFDAVHADQLWMAPYAERCVGTGRTVLDQHNAVFLAVRRMATGERSVTKRALINQEANKLERFERDTCGRFDNVVWVSDVDRQALNAGGRVDSVIPIAIDPSVHHRIQRTNGRRITFIGGMHWPPNAEGIRWFGEAVWPLIAAADPTAILTIIGKGAPRECSRWGERLEATGYLENLQPYLEETAVFIVPLLSGAGMRVKILDAWCAGLPVVSTTVGAEGLEARHEGNLLIADSAEEFADSVTRALQDRALAKRIGEDGRATVEQSYDWREAYQAWDAVYR